MTIEIYCAFGLVGCLLALAALIDDVFTSIYEGAQA